MDIKRKESKSVISNQSSVIKTSRKRKFFDPSAITNRLKKTNIYLFKTFKRESKEAQPRGPLRLSLKNLNFQGFKFTKKRKLIFSLFLVLLIILPTYFIFFHKKASASWWDDNWFYRRLITINSAQIPGDLTNYPMLVSLTDSNLINKAQTDGDDIIFIQANGERLNHEIEKYDNTTGELIAWVKIPQLDGDNDSIIYMYYGNQTIDNQQRPEDVWDDNFKTVQHLEEGGTGTRYDSTRSNNDAFTQNYEGDESTSSGTKIGKADILDGSNDFLKINDNDGLDFTDNYTLSFWIKSPSSVSGWDAFLSKESWNANSGWLVFYNDSSFLIFNTNSNTRISIANPLLDQQWHHVNVVVASGTSKLIIDGVEVGTGTNTVTSNNVKVFIGARHTNDGSDNPTDFLTGTIDEVHISNAPRSANWITTEYNNQNSPTTFISLGTEEKSPAPVLYLPLDEGYGTIAHDESSNKNNGTITGATWKDESECVSGKCLGFGTSAQYISRADQGVNDPLRLTGGEVTLEAWIRSTNGASEQKIIDKRSRWNALYGYSMFIDSTTNSLFFEYGNGTAYTQRPGVGTNNALSINKWHHVAVTLSGTTISYFVDGKSYGTQTGIAGIAGDAATFSIGYSYGRSMCSFKGSIDEPKIYPYARTASQIKQDYNAGLAGISSKKGASASLGDTSNKWLTDGLVGYWKMDETSGTTVIDSSGNNNTGTLNGAQETGTSDASGNTVTTIIDTDGALSTTDDAYNGMIFRFTAACGSITSGTERLISDYTGATKTFTTILALASVPNSCPYEIRHQAGGKFGSGLKSEGNEFLQATNNSSLQITENITVSIWAKHDEYIDNTNNYFFEKGGSYLLAQGWGLDSRFSVNIGGISYQNPSYTIPDVERTIWHHYVGTYSSTTRTIKFYIDGVERGSNTLSGLGSYTIDSNSSNLKIFSQQLAFDRHILHDEARIYNRALSPDEVQKLYSYAPSPMLHLKMDEKTGTTAYDSSGYNNHGTLNNGPIWENGKNNSALLLDGNNDTVSGSFTSTANKTAVTLEAWVWVKSFSQRPSVLCSTPAAYCLFLVSPGSLQMYLRSDQGWVGVTTTDTYNWTDGWHHIASTYSADEQKVKLYRDGRLVYTGARTGLINADVTGFIVGMENSNYFKGPVDDVKIYNYARTQEQILEDMGSMHMAGDAPIEYWKFDGSLKSGVSGGSDALVFDSGTANYSNGGKFSKAIDLSILESGSFSWVNNNTLRDSTKSWTVNQWAGYQFSQIYNGSQYCQDTINSNTATDIVFSSTCSSFASSLSYVIKKNIYLSGPMPNQPTDKITGSLWFKSNSSQSARIVRAQNESFNLTIGGASVSGAIIAFANAITYSTNPHDGRWHHMAITWDGTKQKLYYDGMLVASGEITGTLSSLNKVLTIGARNDGCTELFDGLIDEVKIYSYALGEDEIKTLYNDSSAMAMGNDESRNNNGTAVTGANKDYCIPGDSAKCDKPVLELKMDEKEGTTVYDTSGNGFNGSFESSPAWEAGKTGGALKFDGVDDSVNVGDLNNLIDGVSKITVSVWIKDTGSSYYDSFIGKYSNVTNQFMFITSDLSRGDKDDIEFCLGFGQCGYTNNNIHKLNTWEHWEAVFDGTQSTNASRLKLYLNGVEQSLTFNGTIPATTYSSDYSLRVGARDNNGGSGYNFAGQIDDVKIYNYARTPSQIAWDYNRGKEINRWKFDEGSGTTTHDSGQNKNDGTITGATWKNESECKVGKCLSFDGVDDYINIDSVTSYFNNQRGSFSTWVKRSFLDTVSADKYLFHIFYNNGNFHTIRYLKDTDEWEFAVDRAYTNNTVKLGASVIPQNIWTHILMTWDEDGDDVRVYINGENKGSNSAGGSYVAIPTIGRIGSDRANAYIFEGLIDNSKIYNYALSPLQVQQDYNGGAVNFK